MSAAQEGEGVAALVGGDPELLTFKPQRPALHVRASNRALDFGRRLADLNAPASVHQSMESSAQLYQ